jgi:hypothetical protein
MLIAIPSMGRPAKQVTLKNLTSIGMKVKNPVFVCVPENQRRRYETYMRAGAELVTVPDSIRGISPTRKWIMEELSKRDPKRHVLMLDDDMDFCYRPVSCEPTLKTITDSDQLQRMVDTLEGWLNEGLVHVGLSARQGNNRPFNDEAGVHALHPYRDATRMMNAYAYDMGRLPGLGVELGRMEVMEDFDLTLQLLRKGFPNRVLFDYCWNQRGSGAEGGCSTYRTPEMQAGAAHKLKELHPDFVTVTKKESKESSQAWKGMKERVDVMVKWREAFASSGKKLGAA